MRICFAAMTFVALNPFMSQAKADPHLWCAEYGTGHGGRICSYVTLEHCRAAIVGNSRAICIPNPQFDGRQAKR